MSSLAASKADDFLINATRPDQDRKILRKEHGITVKQQKFYMSIDDQCVLRVCLENDRRLSDRVEYFRVGRYSSLDAAKAVFDQELKVLAEARESPYDRHWFSGASSVEKKQDKVAEYDRVRVSLTADKFGKSFEKHLRKGDHVTVRSSYVQLSSGGVNMFLDSVEAIYLGEAHGKEFVYSDGGTVRRGKWSDLVRGEKFEVDIWIYHFRMRTEDEVVQYAIEWLDKSQVKRHLNNCQTFAQRCHTKRVYVAGKKINCKVYSIV